MPLPERKTPRLRWGRVSVPDATYFVTACTKNRETVFANRDVATKALSVLDELPVGHDADILAATIMPDHVHLLFTLGARLSFGQVIAKFKTLARERGRVAWHWQDESFEHRLRATDSPEDYAFYIFMNPYRANLIPLTVRWPAWFCPDPKRFLFLSYLTENEPVPREWLGKSEEIAARITVHS
jgi:putative transposase